MWRGEEGEDRGEVDVAKEEIEGEESKSYQVLTIITIKTRWTGSYSTWNGPQPPMNLKISSKSFMISPFSAFMTAASASPSPLKLGFNCKP